MQGMDFATQRNIGLFEILGGLYLILSIRLCFFMNKHSNPQFRKWFATILGLVNVTLILNTEVWHFILACVINIFLIVVSGPKYCHIVAFVGMFSYIIIYRLIYYLQGILLGQILIVCQCLAVLMVVGIAFEINLAYKKKHSQNKDSKLFDPTEDDLLKLGFLDIFHYVFNCATVNTGPYLRYQVYSDFINLPFSRAIRRTRISLFEECIFSPCCLLLFAITTDIWPVQYVLTPDFNERSFVYRFLYAWLQWLRYRSFLYSSFSIIRMNSGVTGLGAYPVENKCTPAHGPTVNNNDLRNIKYEEAKTMDLDLETTIVTHLRCEVTPTVTASTRQWNQCVQYWLAVYIYKQLPYSMGKPARKMLTLFVSTIWHTVYPMSIFSTLVGAHYYYLESLYIKLQTHQTGKMVSFMNVCFWISRSLCWGWFMMTYFLLDADKIMSYYKSTYYAGFVYLITMHLLYVLIFSKYLPKNKKV